MNNIYKVIWSKVTNVLVVVSELARSKGVSGRNSTAASSNTAKVRTKLTAHSASAHLQYLLLMLMLRMLPQQHH